MSNDTLTADDDGTLTIDGTRYITLACAVENAPDEGGGPASLPAWRGRVLRNPDLFRPIKRRVDMPSRGGPQARILVPLAAWKAHKDTYVVGAFDAALAAAKREGVQVWEGPQGPVVSFDDAMTIYKQWGIEIEPFSVGARHVGEGKVGAWLDLDDLRKMRDRLRVRIKDASDE